MYKKNDLLYNIYGTPFDRILAYLLDRISISKRIQEEANYDKKAALEFLGITNIREARLLGMSTAASALNIGCSNGIIADIGCGPGRISIYMAEMLKKNKISGSDITIIAVDKSHEMINILEEDINSLDLSDYICVIKASAYELPFQDDSIDCIIMQDALHEMGNPIQVLREIKRVVKKDGSYIIRDLRRPPNKFALNFIIKLFARRHNKYQREMFRSSLKSGFTGIELNELAEKAKLSNYYIRPTSITHIDIIKYSRKCIGDSVYTVNSGNVIRDKIQRKSYVLHKNLG